MKNYPGLVASKYIRKCPMCSVRHYWPTDDKLCYVCEKEWVEYLDYVDPPDKGSFKGGN